MRKFLAILLLLCLPCLLFAKELGTVAISFGPSLSYYSIEETKVFSNELSVKLCGSNPMVKDWEVRYAIGFNFPSISLVNGSNVGLSNRLTDLTLEGGFSYRLPLSKKISLSFGPGLSFFMGTRPLSKTERVYQYALNLEGTFSTLFKINPMFGINLDLKLYTPLWLYTTGSNVSRHSCFNGFYLMGLIGFIYNY